MMPPVLPMRRQPRLAALLAAVALAVAAAVGLGGCGDEGGSARLAAGRYEATSEGALAGALAGEAVYRLDDAGRLVGLELGAAGAPTGLSIELAPLPPAPRTYEIVAPALLAAAAPEGLAEGDAPPAATAYLTAVPADTIARAPGSDTAAAAPLQLTATHGVVQITHADGGILRATFDLHFVGTLPDAHAEVTAGVAGTVRAEEE